MTVFQNFIYQSEFRVIAYKKDQNLFYDRWQPSSAKMTSVEHGQENLSLLELVGRYKPKSYLLDLRDYQYELCEDDYNEMLLNSNLLLDLGIEKIALNSKEELEDYELIQSLIKSNKRLKENTIQFFQSIKKANNWLLK